MAIEIRQLKDSELALANDFFNSIYQTKRSFENFSWEFINGPEGKAIYIGALDTDAGNSIVGIQCAIPLALMDTKGNSILTAKSEDTLVDPAYRGQKIFERMYDVLFEECKKAGIKYIWGFTPALKAFERIGFQAPFHSRQGLLAFSPIKTYFFLKNLNSKNKLIDKFKIMALSFGSMLIGLKRIFVTSSAYEVKKIELNSKTELIKKLYGDSKYFFINQDLKYQQWRLIQNPFGNNYTNYQFLNKENNVISDVLINVRENVSYIEQLYFHNGLKEEHKKQILKTIVIEIRKSKAPFIRTLCFNTNEELQSQISLLKTIGFTILDRGNYFVWKSLESQNSITPEKLFITRLFTQGNL